MTRQLNIRMEDDLYDALHEAAAEDGPNLHRWLIAVLEDAVARRGGLTADQLARRAQMRAEAEAGYVNCDHPLAGRKPLPGIREGKTVQIGFFCSRCGRKVYG